MERPEYLDPDTMEPRVKNIHMPPGTRGARVRRDGGAACDEKRRLCLHEMIGGGLHPLLLAAGQWSNPKPRGKIGAKYDSWYKPASSTPQLRNYADNKDTLHIE